LNVTTALQPVAFEVHPPNEKSIEYRNDSEAGPGLTAGMATLMLTGVATGEEPKS
jgi:hypothetical protein